MVVRLWSFFFINFRKCIRPVRWLETFTMLVLQSAAELDCQKLNLCCQYTRLAVIAC